MIKTPLRSTALLAAALLGLYATQASAIQFELESLGISGVLNNIGTVGAQWRTEHPSEDLIGKANINPGLCGGGYQSCQSIFKDQIYPSQRLVAAPGAASMHNDNGDLNYTRYSLTQGGVRLTQDLTLTKGTFGFFARTIAFYDAVNDHKPDRFGNLITSDNLGRTGTTGDPVANRYFSRVYGPGEVVGLSRNNPELRRQEIADYQVLDFNFFGKLPLPGSEKEVTFKLGRQTVNWGESTLLVINSINQAQPVNANNLNRFGFQLEEVFTPVAMAFASAEILDGHTLEAFYQFEWKPVEIPAPGSFQSFVDLGSRNLGDYVNLSFGGSADDASGKGFFLDNPLSLVTGTTAAIHRLPDRTPTAAGQFGVALKNYFADLNNGTEISLYFMNYHSRLPYVSFISGDQSCAKRNFDGNHPLGAANTLQLLQACPRLPALVDTNANGRFRQDAIGYLGSHPAALIDAGINPADPTGGLMQLAVLTGNPDGNTNNLDDLVKLDSGPLLLEYPKNIQLYGVSFNTTAGEYSLQGEVAYRPNLPLQVSVIDVAFAAAQPFLTNCQDPALGCAGSQGGGTGFMSGAGDRGNYGASDVVAGCTAGAANCDTINLLLGAAPSAARAFPSFLAAYRGQALGDFPEHTYIPGYERKQVLEYNLGITRVLGATDNVIGADQILAVAEIGATHVLNMPRLDQLQFDAPGVYYHASAGADGSGADGSRQACSTNPNCVVGPDGLRFNPHQANLHNFATSFSWGYRIVQIIKYESVLPGISLQPFIIWSHDVNGISPGPAGNFVRGRKSVNFALETRYKSALSGTLGYTWNFGGGERNVVHDRDAVQAFVRYQF